MMNTSHKQVIHAILQPVMLRAPSLCRLHTRLHSKHSSHITYDRLCAFKSQHILKKVSFSGSHQPDHAVRCRQGILSLGSKTTPISLPSSACRAASAGRTATPTPGPVPVSPGLSGIVLTDSEGSDEDDADSATEIEELSNGQTDVDEAVTGYIQNRSAGVQLVKSRAEAHDQVKDGLMIPLHGVAQISAAIKTAINPPCGCHSPMHVCDLAAPICMLTKGYKSHDCLCIEELCLRSTWVSLQQFCHSPSSWLRYLGH